MQCVCNMTQASWKRMDGASLLSSLADGSIDDFFNPVPGIYAWRLNLAYPSFDPIRGAAILANFTSLFQYPTANTSRRYLSHSIVLKGLEISPKPMEEKKRRELESFIKRNPANADWFQKYLASVSQQMPNLYVGQTIDLRQRIKTHVSGGTDFGEYILNDWPGTFENLYLEWLEIPGAGSSTLQVMEYIAQTFTISGLSKRAG